PPCSSSLLLPASPSTSAGPSRPGGGPMPHRPLFAGASMHGEVRERMGRLARLIDERVGWAVLALLLQPILLLLLNPGALTPDSYARCYDPWIYFGFATNLEQLEALKTTYCSTRLPAILPYWAFYKVFNPWWAHHLSHLSFYYATTLSLYAVV